MEEDGIERAQGVADAAAGALLLVDGGADRFEGNFLLLDLAQDAGRRGRALRDTGRDIFRTLDTAGDVDAFGHGRHRVQLGMSFDEPAVRPAGNAEQFGHLLRVMAGFQTGGQDDHIHRDAALLADQGIFHLDDQLAFFARACGRHR